MSILSSEPRQRCDYILNGKPDEKPLQGFPFGLIEPSAGIFWIDSETTHIYYKLYQIIQSTFSTCSDDILTFKKKSLC